MLSVLGPGILSLSWCLGLMYHSAFQFVVTDLKADRLSNWQEPASLFLIWVEKKHV